MLNVKLNYLRLLNEETDKVFISTTKLPKNDIVVGSEVDVRYTKYGKVEAIIND